MIMVVESLQNDRHAVCVDIADLLRGLHCIQLT
jgi:hypothetical protein